MSGVDGNGLKMGLPPFLHAYIIHDNWCKLVWFGLNRTATVLYIYKTG